MLSQRLKSQQEELPFAPGQRKIIRRSLREKSLQSFLEERPRRQFIEQKARLLILGPAPFADKRISRVFQPLIIILDFDSMILIGDRLSGRVHFGPRGAAGEEPPAQEEADGGAESKNQRRGLQWSILACTAPVFKRLFGF